MNSEHYQEFNVVMLPALKQEYQVKKGELFINDSRQHPWGKLHTLKCERITSHGHAWNGDGIHTYINHLYILSDEKIKEGDWFILTFGFEKPEILQATKENIIAIKSNCKKIIATTNSNLISESKLMRECYPYSIHQIPQSFIEYFINEYNKGNVITKVLVEVDKDIYKIKFNQNNEINILTEQKQETLYETGQDDFYQGFIEGVKSQCGRYSKEDLFEAFYAHDKGWLTFDSWFGQIKKK